MAETTAVSRLNSIFDDYPGTDLDFITPSYTDGMYVVIWFGVVWFNDSSFSTYTNRGVRSAVSGRQAHPDSGYLLQRRGRYQGLLPRGRGRSV